ncbi:hypothetical protein [Pacificoceanicola onchidii]|uniref:hypothetical protein n=1 Tax=Pacificoceanicola onchidii TaxID=2562685 RepID=UPI0010A4F4F8|nr:hypothetical protein [Pacificoceanicola onchidii]
MIDILFILSGIAFGGGSGETSAETAAAGAAMATSSSASATAVAAPAAEAPKYQAESQVPTGKFTTATEVKPILEMTRANWVAVREYNGQDLVYLTHLLSWRCGLVAIHVGLNGGPLEEWPMEACHMDSNSPNAMTAPDGVIYKGYPLGSVETISVEITYDDLTADAATFDRNGAMIP